MAGRARCAPYNPLMQAPSHFDVAVVGRGAVGASAALGLAQAGLRVCQVGPASPAPAHDAQGWDARVFALSPASRELLRSLRIWDALPHERIAPVYDMRVYAGASAQAPELHLDAYTGCVESLAWIIENRSLMITLESALRFAGVESFNDEVAASALEGAGTAGRRTLELKSGHRLSARLVVAADGAHSAMRTLAGIETTVREYGQRAVVANFNSTLAHADTAWQWFDAQLGVLALLPLPAGTDTTGRVSMVWSAPEPLAEELLQLSPQALAQRVSEASQHALGELHLITPAHAFPLRLIRVPRLLAPRMVLVGDAAHVMHPLAGQGMNVGLGDISQLLAVLRGREFYRDLGDELLWRRYERARREAVVRMQAATDGLQRIFGPVPAPLAGLRDLGWRAVARSGWMRRRLVAQAVQ